MDASSRALNQPQRMHAKKLSLIGVGDETWWKWHKKMLKKLKKFFFLSPIWNACLCWHNHGFFFLCHINKPRRMKADMKSAMLIFPLESSLLITVDCEKHKVYIASPFCSHFTPSCFHIRNKASSSHNESCCMCGFLLFFSGG